MSADGGGCAHPEQAGKRFCTLCGASLAAVCPACSTPIVAGQRFCGECGSPLGVSAEAPSSAAKPPAASEGERKQVTVLFADAVRSMELAERLDADELSEVMQGLFAVCREAVEAFGGTVDKFTGDGVMALFGAPVAQEDHARRACHAALRLVAGVAGYAAALPDLELAIRVGLNSGEVVAGSVGKAFTAVGHTVGLAQRMEGLAEPGTVRLSEHTAALVGPEFRVRDLGATAVKGVGAPVGVWALDAAAGGVSSAARRRSGSARLVGRDAELAGLESALAGAREGRAQVVGIVAEAGAGKSRLCEELARRAGELGVTVRRTAGVSHAQSVPLLPILGYLRDYFGVQDGDSAAEVREQVTTALLHLDPAFESDLGLICDFMEVPDPERPAPQLAPQARRARVLDVFRRATARRTEHQTLLLILEDLHWFDPHSVEFLDAWLPSFPGSRTLVVTNFRPEFHAPWMGHSYYRQLPLAPLDGAASQELLDELLGRDPSLGGLTEQLIVRTGGNPFFAEEIVRALAADGTLAGEPGSYYLTRSATEVRVPATVQVVLAQRIDRLAAPEKAVLQAASVIGRTFTAPVLVEATKSDDVSLSAILDALSAKELVQRTGSEGEYRFWHPLTQEVAYGTLLSASRRRLHREVAAALIGLGPDRHDELAGLLATHFEAAGDDLEAGRWQVRAGIRANRTDYGEAQIRLRRGLDYLGSVPETQESLELRVRAGAMFLRSLSRFGTDDTEIEQVFARTLDDAQRLGDPSLLGLLLAADFALKAFAGELVPSLAVIPEARRHADRSGDPGLRGTVMWCEAFANTWMNPEAGFRALSALEELSAFDTSLGLTVWAYSLHDVARLGRALLCLETGRLLEAGGALDEAFELLSRRPAAEVESWALSASAILADRIGETARADAVRGAAGRGLTRGIESGSIPSAVRASLGLGLAALLAEEADHAVAAFEEGLSTARKRRRGLLDEPRLLASLARAHLLGGDPTTSRACADEALAVARNQRTPLGECQALWVRALVFRQTATDDADRAVARAAALAAQELVVVSGATTYTPFLAEELARLEGDESALHAAADGYAAIGASGHARRLRDELGLPNLTNRR